MRRLVATTGGDKYELEVHPMPGASHHFRVAIRRPDGTEESQEVQILSRTTERWTVALEGDRILDAVVSTLADCILVNWNGRSYRINVSNKKRQNESTAPDHASSDIVRADMAGKVASILKKSGDSVEAGEALAILEAMKMQNPIKAPRSGRIRQCNLTEGQLVSAGQVLFELEETTDQLTS